MSNHLFLTLSTHLPNLFDLYQRILICHSVIVLTISHLNISFCNLKFLNHPAICVLTFSSPQHEGIFLYPCFFLFLSIATPFLAIMLFHFRSSNNRPLPPGKVISRSNVHKLHSGVFAKIYYLSIPLHLSLSSSFLSIYTLFSSCTQIPIQHYTIPPTPQTNFSRSNLLHHILK
jgi:hypothetical protein